MGTLVRNRFSKIKKTIEINRFYCRGRRGGGGIKQNAPGGKLSRWFLEIWGVVLLGHSRIIIKWT